jgi:hypothetical protein
MQVDVANVGEIFKIATDCKKKLFYQLLLEGIILEPSILNRKKLCQLFKY